MKKFLVFILLLVSNYTSLLACGFYPYGEEVRISILNHHYFNCKTFDGFHYSSSYYTFESPYRENDIHPNDELWFEYCNGKVPIAEIVKAVYEVPKSHFTKTSSNEMIQYLFQQNDFEAINYLKFAKSCEIANMFYSDPWERYDRVELQIYQNKIDNALRNSLLTKKESLQLRYKFLAIRLAFYSGKWDELIKIYATIPETKKPTIINYWSLYFRAIVENDKSLQSFYAAQVFANAPDKRFAVYSYFDKNINLSLVLKHAKTNTEKSNVYALAATKKYDRALEYIKKAYELNPSSDFNDFIILREVNKIEDWVFTPYYTNFQPSVPINNNLWYENKLFSYKRIEQRINKDRKYAGEVLNFLKSIKSTNNSIKTCQAQLAFISKRYDECSDQLNYLEQTIPKKDSLFFIVQKIKALNLTANQTQNKTKITKNVQQVLLQNKHDKKFIFAIARELEYKGNTTDAAFLFSKINDEENYAGDYGYGLAWKSRKNKRHSYRDYFYDYFGYVDVLYTTNQIEDLIKNTSSDNNRDEFSKWLKSRLIAEKTQLYDLLGTKYIRQNKLQKALDVFSKIEDKYWIDKYSLWNDVYSSEEKIFDQNPFFTLKYTPQFIKEKEDFYLTKKSVTKKLIEYLSKANNPDEKNRDYYYFLVANCYRNMTVNGNSWMMRRYGISDYNVEPFPEDEEEFQKGFLAKKYYRLAKKYSNSKKFKALCLWLAEDYSTLKKTSKKEYYELSHSNCTAFEDYFEARRFN